MVIYTIGFSKKNLREFVARLKRAGVKKVIDIRLNNTSQLAGYAKKDDLAYVLELVGVEYEHLTNLAPTQDLLDSYKKKAISWPEYEKRFLNLLQEREASTYTNRIAESDAVCFLCAEDKPNFCHRRLVAEYFASLIPGTRIEHL
ncbi:MAG: DUF488 domain-containing protein [Syntrophothermus sp.]|uniref:DUF488 domain-containing protein n=1 Tax=Syntrophothermus sp. TaxID=2736299 RepID=UPI00257989A7|nr:DUF488 domain-containing protein [Syntrophothermus sp.]NSW83204.1 DUF488 domain-containing protein [Syntrophothermus sp.]